MILVYQMITGPTVTLGPKTLVGIPVLIHNINMKKFITSMLAILCIVPAFAQKGNAVKASVDALCGRVSLTDAVTRQVAKRTSILPEIRLAPSLPSYQMPAVAPSVPAAFANRLPLREIQQISITTRGRFPFPFKNDNREGVLYRGMHLNNFEDLRNILVNGLEIKASPRGIIYTARRPATAVTFAVTLLTEGEFPVLVRLPVTQKLLRTNPPNESCNYYQTTFYKDISSDMIEVFAFIKINAKAGWYRVTLTSDNQLFFTFVQSQTTLPIIEEDM